MVTKILVIDDQLDNLVFLSELLQELIQNSEIITAQTGAEGIKKAEMDPPDTILLDIFMPGMDGFEVCKRLKSSERTKFIPIILLTAIHTDTSSHIKGLELGADAFLSKPIDEVELTAQIKVMLRIKEMEDHLRHDKGLLELKVRERTEKLQENEKMLRALMDAPVDSIGMIDTKGKLLDCNPTFARRFNKTREELLFHNLWKLLPTDLAAKRKEYVR